jgi:hypothetical protein
MRPVARLLHAFTTSLLVVCVVVQIFLAGLGVFDDPAMFLSHAGFGYLIEALTLVVLVTALLAGAGRRQVGLAALAFGLMILQSVFVGLRTELPTVAALHPVNGFLIGLIALVMARAAWRAARTRGTDSAAEVGEASTAVA